MDTKEVLGFGCFFTRRSLDAELFLREVPQYCENRPVFLVDKGRGTRSLQDPRLGV